MNTIGALPWYVVAASALVAAALPLAAWALAGARPAERKQVARNLAGVEGATDLRQVVLARSAGDRAIRPLLSTLTGLVRRLTPQGWTARLQRRLDLAGRPVAWPLERILALKALLAIVVAAFGALVWVAEPSAQRLIGAAAATLVGFFTPDLVLYGRGQERQQVLQRELPDALDQMTISMEAGLGFDAAMARTGRTGTGPIADEFVRTLQDMQVGVSRREALGGLADRTDVRDLSTFVTAITQAEVHGIPIGDVLRTQADEMRVKRRQRAEEQAMKIPVKVVFPLILCILPVLVIVILGPAAIQISQELFGAGGAL